MNKYYKQYSKIFLPTSNFTLGPLATLASHMNKSFPFLPSNSRHLSQFFISAISLTENRDSFFCILESLFECGIMLCTSCSRCRPRWPIPRELNTRVRVLLVHFTFLAFGSSSEPRVAGTSSSTTSAGCKTNGVRHIIQGYIIHKMLWWRNFMSGKKINLNNRNTQSTKCPKVETHFI